MARALKIRMDEAEDEIRIKKELIVSRQKARLSGVRLVEKKGRGRCVLAAKKYNVGDVVFADEALEWILLPSMRQERCEGCCRSLKKRMKCVCGSFFCSKQCHQKSWGKHHRNECAKLKRTGIESRLAARIERRVSTEESLSTSRLDLLGMSLWRTVDQDWISLGRANNFCLSDDLLNPVAALVCPLAALLNHSCDPNCVSAYEILDDVPTHYFVAVKSIVPGDELFHSYLDLSDDYEKRQATLLKHYGFRCDCSRCQNQKNQQKPPQSILEANRQLRARAALINAEDPDAEALLLQQAAQLLDNASCPCDWPDAIATLESRAHCELARGNFIAAFTMLSHLTAIREEKIFLDPHPRLALDYVILRDCALTLLSVLAEKEQLSYYRQQATAAHRRALDLLRATRPPHSQFIREQLQALAVL